MRNKIVVIGSSNVDLIMKMDHLPALGETVTDAEFFQVYGGKGANQAVGAARAGGNVSIVNCVGEDAYTPQMIKNYKDDGIDTRFVFQETGMSSGHALVMIGDAGNNYLSVAPGANYRLTPEKIDEALSVIDEAAMILLQYEILAETNQYVIDLAGKKGIPVMWNFAPAREIDRSYIGKSDILILNEVEAEFLTRVKVSGQATAEEAAGILLKGGTDTVVITLGSRGSIAFRGADQYLVPAFKVESVDTTAAGDIFCGSLAVAMNEGNSLEEALRFANAAAALSVTRIGAQPSAPRREEIDRFLEEN